MSFRFKRTCGLREAERLGTAIAKAVEYCIVPFPVEEKSDAKELKTGLPHSSLNPLRTAVPFWGQTSRILSNVSPKRNCGPKRVKDVPLWPEI